MAQVKSRKVVLINFEDLPYHAKIATQADQSTPQKNYRKRSQEESPSNNNNIEPPGSDTKTVAKKSREHDVTPKNLGEEFLYVQVDNAAADFFFGRHPDTFKRLLESALEPLNGTDFQKVRGMNEMAFKACILGVFSSETAKRELFIISEASMARVFPDMTCKGNADLLLSQDKQTFVLLELKYLSLAYLQNKTQSVDEIDVNTQFSYNDESGSIRFMALDLGEQVATDPNNSNNIIITPKQLMVFALEQARQYRIQNKHSVKYRLDSNLIKHKYGVVGFADKVLIEKLPADI